LKNRKQKSQSSVANDEDIMDHFDGNREFSHIISFGPNNRQPIPLKMPSKSEDREVNYQYMENKHFVNTQTSGIASVNESQRREDALISARLAHIQLNVKAFLDKSFNYDFCFHSLINTNNSDN
jgi:hypothetical protein